MDSRLTFHYDRIGGILYINKCEPYVGQESEMLDDKVVVRLNPKTNAVDSQNSRWPHNSLQVKGPKF